MMNPPLEKDHKVFEKDYCPGYTDSYGKWNTGFPCPTIYCCGTSVHKYCCSGESSSKGSIQHAVVEMETEMEITTDYNDHLAPPLHPLDIGRNSYVAAVICGLVAVTVLMTLVSCFYCSCCLLYKKRRAQLSSGGLYRIPASSTTCGLINSANGSAAGNATTPVTTPLNPLFTSDSWTSSNNPPQGQLLRTNPPMPEPPSGLRAHVNPTLLNSNGNSTNNNMNPISLNSTSVPPSARFQQPLQVSGAPLSGNNVSRLHRQLSLLHQQNPNLLRSICNNNSHHNNNSNNRQSYSIHNIPTIYNTTGRANNNTMSSIISSVSSSGSSSTNSLPPPYFLEQYRIRNRVRQPRNLPPATLLPSYNDIQRQTQGQQQQSRRQPNQNHHQQENDIPCQQQPLELNSSTMNDLSAPPRRNRERPQNNNSRPGVSGSTNRTDSNTGGPQIILISNVPPSPTLRSNQFESPTREKILNTSQAIQRTLSDAKRSRDEDLQDIRKESSLNGRNRVKSHSLENVSSSIVIKDTPSVINAEMRVNHQAHAN